LLTLDYKEQPTLLLNGSTADEAIVV